VGFNYKGMRNEKGQFIQGHKRPKQWIDIQKKVSIGNKYGLGNRHSEEVKEKIRKSSKERWENPEYKKRISEKLKGHIVSEETRKKISEANKGKKPSQKAIEKSIKSRIGKHHSRETKKKMSEAHLKNPVRHWLGKKMSVEIRKKLSESHKGEKSSFWRGGITPKNTKIRNSIEMSLWREAVFLRDSYTCQKCGVRGGKLHSHHIKSFAQYPELRFAINNGQTLCRECHKKTNNYLKNYEIR